MPENSGNNLDVLSIGICAVDALGRPVDEYPEKGKIARLNGIAFSLGGPAAATAVTLARVGAEVSLVGRIGADWLGEYFLENIKESGVDTSHLVRDDQAPTDFTFVAISSDGDRTFFHCPGAGKVFSIDDIDLGLVKNAGVVHIGGAFTMNAFDGAGTLDVLKTAKEAGALTSMDTLYNSDKDAEELLGDAYPFIDYLFMGYHEGVIITGKEAPHDIASYVLDRGCRVAVVKLGEKGSYILTEEVALEVEPFPTTVVDTCGAGDVYVGGFLFGVTQDWPIEKCGRLGALLASYSVSAIGGTTAVPKGEDLGYLESLL